MRNNEQRVSVAPISIYLYNLRFLELCFVAKVSFLLVWLQVSIEQSCCGDRFFSYCSCCILMRIGQLKFCMVCCFPFFIFALCANRKKAHCFFFFYLFSEWKQKEKFFPFLECYMDIELVGHGLSGVVWHGLGQVSAAIYEVWLDVLIVCTIC